MRASPSSSQPTRPANHHQPRRVSIDNVVYNMTEFVKQTKEVDKDTGMRIAKHPGGMDIPLQFAGKDASMYWNDIHGHVKYDILEDLTMEEGLNTGLDVLPIVMGRTEGDPPPEAQLEGGLPATQKPDYTEVVPDSLNEEGADAGALLGEMLEGIEPGSTEARALGAIIGVFTADAAAQPCHWNYAQSVYQQELKNRERWDAPEFMNPSLNAFYRIPCGSNSCYCDQGFVIMESLAEEGIVDPDDIDERFEEYFAEGGTGDYGSLDRDSLTTGLVLPIDGKWRHGSITGYMRNVNAGMHWPRSGTGDSQIDSCIKIVPVVALYAGHPDMIYEVEDAIRVSQDNEDAVAFGCAFARILEACILGESGEEAVATALESLEESDEIEDGFVAKALASAVTPERCATATLEEGVMDVIKDAPRPGLA